MWLIQNSTPSSHCGMRHTDSQFEALATKDKQTSYNVTVGTTHLQTNQNNQNMT